MRFKRYFLALMMVAFHALALTAGEVWTAKNVPIPFLRDSTQYVSDPDGYVDKAQKDSANFYLQKLKLSHVFTDQRSSNVARLRLLA